MMQIAALQTISGALQPNTFRTKHFLMNTLVSGSFILFRQQDLYPEEKISCVRKKTTKKKQISCAFSQRKSWIL